MTPSSLRDEYAELKHSYLERLCEFQKKLKELVEREADAKKKQARKFPQSEIEFNDSPREVQERVAKYLVSDKNVQEKMRDEFEWAWKMTEALMNEFRSNVSSLSPSPGTPALSARQKQFNSAVVALVPTEDPRKRPNLA